MMKGKIIIVISVAASLAGGAEAQRTQGAQSPLVQALANCKAQTDDQARLRCYDAAAGALTAATASGTIVVVDREDVRKTRRSLFGFSLPKLPFFSGDDSASSQQDEITASLASARPLPNGKWQLKLQDGALWETTEAASMSMNDPKAGNAVVIKRGPLGSYMIRVAGQRGIRAKRVG